MKSSIYDQFQLEDQIKTNQNLHIEKIKGTRKKSKIKRIKTEIKTFIYNKY